MVQYAAQGGAALTADPWPWFAVLWLQRKCGLYLPVELQLHVLFVGWTAPLSVLYNPLSMYWYWRPVWEGDGLRPSTAVPEEDVTSRRCRDGGYVVLGDDICPSVDSTFVVDVRDGTRGTVFSYPDDNGLLQEESMTLSELLLGTPRIACIARRMTT